MSGAGFILIINLAVAGLFCISFLVIAAYDRSRLAARWFAGAYAFGVAYTALEAAGPFPCEAGRLPRPSGFHSRFAAYQYGARAPL
jgi:hypothetical protein